MLDNEKNQKLLELTNRAVCINEELLEEEKRFIEALSQRREVSILKEISKKISLLMRKEVLYNGAAISLLQKY
jgi:hypothetical protein